MLTPQQKAWADDHLNKPTTAQVEGVVTAYVEHPDGRVRFRVDGPDVIAVFAAIPPPTEDHLAALDEAAQAEADRQEAIAAEKFQAAVQAEVERVLAARS